LWADKPLPASITARSPPVGTTVGITIIEFAPIAATIAIAAPMVATIVASMAAPMVAVPRATIAESWRCYEHELATATAANKFFIATPPSSLSLVFIPRQAKLMLRMMANALLSVANPIWRKGEFS